jgi:hypothetical protein
LTVTIAEAMIGPLGELLRMMHQRFWLICTAALLVPTPARSDTPELVSDEKIWDHGAHNAFTDLIRWRNKWYCTFREADAHVGGNGKVRVLESADGRAWGPGSLIAEEGIDLRDPKLSITPDDRLMIVAGGSVYQGTKTLKGRQPRVAFSADGREWTAPRRVLSEGDWLWRVTWHDGKAYGISYDASARDTPAAKDAARTGKVDPGPSDWKLKLMVSADGLKYDLVTHLDVPGHPNESTLRILPDGEMIALVRREGGNTFGWVGCSKPPYTAWRWHETKYRLGGPNFIRLPDGSLWAAGRSYPGGARTVVARMSRDSYEPALTLPSGGDTSYPGLVWNDGLLWMSYYSSHEGRSAIYLAKVKLPLDAEDIGSQLQPFVDEYLIDRLAGTARLEVQRPEPREVVFTADRPWEGNTSAYYTIFRDGDTYRMYYRGAHFDESTKKAAHPEVTCYAESKDGIAWARPELGLFAFDGSKRNNIVWDGPGAHNFTPFKDTNPNCPAEARYKALAGVKGGLMALRSADGLHWGRLTESPVITRGAFDSQNLAFWDEQAGKYREYHRAFRGERDIMTETSDDFTKWTDPIFLEYPGAPKEHLYTNAVLPYPRAPQVLIAFPTRFLPATQQTEPIFMASRDGRIFRRYNEAVIPTTAPSDRDGNRSNYMAWGLVQLPGRDREFSVYAKEAYYTGKGSRVRRFVYRLDGFVALHAGTEGGEAVTRPVRFQGRKLVVNYRTAEQGSVRAELLDGDGSPLPGFGASESRELRGDDVAGTATWPRGGDLGALAGQAVRIRLVLKDADVFSFRFEE